MMPSSHLPANKRNDFNQFRKRGYWIVTHVQHSAFKKSFVLDVFMFVVTILS